jgi:predicted ATPase/DNA-binding SARP family transcriptional activator
MTQLSLTLLGSFQVTLGEKPANGFESNKVRALLAYVAVEADRPHRRETLAEFFWPERQEGVARKNLKQALANLRKAIGDRKAAPSFLRVTRDDVRFNADSAHLLDVTEFTKLLTACKSHSHRRLSTCRPCIRRLEQAVGLYGGELLEGFFLKDSSAFDEWVLVKREGLQRQMMDALKHLATHYERRGEYEDACETTRRQVELEPWDEDAQRGLMRSLVLNGQRSAALVQYELCLQTLAEELGLEPTDETTALYKQIRDLASEEMGRISHFWPPTTERHNLSPPATPFVGRKTELTEIGEQLENPASRLLTLVGPGGIGKTRLALQVAFDNIGGYDHGVYFIPLAGLSSPEFLATAIADTIGYSFSGQATPEAQLLDYLREKEMLLLVDNFEHLLDGAGLLAEIMTAATCVNMLVTSREQLSLQGEWTYEVRGMQYPRGDWRYVSDLESYSSVQLFEVRARQMMPNFSLETPARNEVGYICQLVGGMPLGVELAAAWVDKLSLVDIASEIQGSLNFLDANWRNAPERHRSMRAVFDTSWQQLSEAERDVFRQLSVFRGGFNRAAVQEVIAAQETPSVFLRLLTGLVSKSLLRFNAERERYEIHDLLHQYGADKLAEDPVEESMVRDRHSAYYCNALLQHQADIQYTRNQEVLAELENDSENIRTAWGWAVTQMQLDRLVQSMDSLCYFCWRRRHYQDGETASRLAVDTLTEEDLTERHSVDAQRLLAKALAWQAHFYWRMGRIEKAEQSLQKCSVTLESSGLADQDTRSEKAFLLGQRGWLAFQSGHYEESKQWFEQSLALYRALGDHWGVADSLDTLGEAAWSLGNFHEAKQRLEELLTLYQAQGNSWGLATVLNRLGRVTRGLVDYEKARRLFDESLALSRVEGNQRGIANSLQSLGFLALFQGRFEDGAGFLRQSVDISREIGDRVMIGYGLLFLGGALWLSGKVAQGYPYLEESMAIINELEDAWLITHSTQYVAMVNVYLGKYEEARAMAKKATEQKVSHPFMIGPAQRALGWVALVEEKYAEAHLLLQGSVATIRAVAEREMLAWSLAALGRASFGLGNHSEAQQHLYEALEIAVEIGAFIPLLYTMPIVSLLLADQGEVERAIELYSLASQHPFVSNSQLFEDIAGRHIAAVSATLPSDVVKAAKARGQALEMWEAASELLEELPMLGWEVQ